MTPDDLATHLVVHGTSDDGNDVSWGDKIIEAFEVQQQRIAVLENYIDTLITNRVEERLGELEKAVDTMRVTSL